MAIGMRKISNFLFATSIVLIASSCGKNPGANTQPANAPSTNTVQTTVAPTSAVPSVSIEDSVPETTLPMIEKRFVLTPSTFRSCDIKTGPIKTIANWDFSGTSTQGVTIYVESPGSHARLWIAGAAKGKATTGAWVYDGMLFTMVDAGTQGVIAQIQVKAIPCE